MHKRWQAFTFDGIFLRQNSQILFNFFNERMGKAIFHYGNNILRSGWIADFPKLFFQIKICLVCNFWPTYLNSQNQEVKQSSYIRGHLLTNKMMARSRQIPSASSIFVWMWIPLPSGTCLHRLVGHTDWVRAVGVSADGRIVVSGSDDRTIKVWDGKRGLLSADRAERNTNTFSFGF